MNKYIAFYRGKKLEITAQGLYPAKIKAIEKFKVKKNKEYMVHVHLAELDNKEYIHTPID